MFISTYLFQVTPWGMRKLLTWVSETYGNPEIFITENGSNDNATKFDVGRIRYLKVNIL